MVDLLDAQCSEVAVRTHIGSLLDVSPATRRNLIEAGSSPSSTESSPESAELRRFKRENAELRRANEILGDRLGVLRRGGTRAPTYQIVDYIDVHKVRLAVEQICPRAREHGITIPPITYHAPVDRTSTAAELNDAYAAHEVFCLFHDQRCVYGAFKDAYRPRRRTDAESKYTYRARVPESSKSTSASTSALVMARCNDSGE